MKARFGWLGIAAALIVACDGGSDPQSRAPAPPPQSGPPEADLTLLFFGNSHTSANNLSGIVAAMVRAGNPGVSVAEVVGPGSMFLDERLAHAPSMELLQSGEWSFVILQAQKYSSSGQFAYSTAEAQELVRRSRDANAVPILFPEWPRRDVEEAQRIYDLHVSIAQLEPACVAPIGQAWDLSLARYPSLTLHATDGNHAAPAGSFLAALVLYATITGRSPLELPFIAQVGVGADSQALLRGIADETVRMTPPRQWCPT